MKSGLEGPGAGSSKEDIDISSVMVHLDAAARRAAEVMQGFSDDELDRRFGPNSDRESSYGESLDSELMKTVPMESRNSLLKDILGKVEADIRSSDAFKELQERVAAKGYGMLVPQVILGQSGMYGGRMDARVTFRTLDFTDAEQRLRDGAF